MSVPLPYRLWPGVLNGRQMMAKPAASLLLALMSNNQLDEALAANSLPALAQLCCMIPELLADLASPLPLQLLAAGMRRLPALKFSPIPPAESALNKSDPDWLSLFLRMFIAYAKHRQKGSNSEGGDDRVLGSVLDALAPCACSMAHHAARLLSAGNFSLALTYNAVSMLSRCADKRHSSCCTQRACSMAEGVPSTAGLANALAMLAEAFSEHCVALVLGRDLDFQRERAHLLATTLMAGVRCAAALCSDPGCLQRAWAQAEGAAAARGSSSASALMSDASLQQLQQAADVFRIGICTARACCTEVKLDDTGAASVAALTMMLESGAVLRATAAAASFFHAVPAARVPEAPAEPRPSSSNVSGYAPAGGTAPGSPSDRISVPPEAANADAGASLPAAERLGPVPHTCAAGSTGGAIWHPSFPPMAWLHTRFLESAGLAAMLCAQLSGVPHGYALRLLGALLGLIRDATGNSCGSDGGAGTSNFEARLYAPVSTLLWLDEARDDLPRVRCSLPPSSH